jgi:Ca2+:H+ antiporter
MLAGGAETTALTRDTVFAAVMIIINGIVGLYLLVGGLRYSEQSFNLSGASAALTVLAALTMLTMLTMILPNVTVTTPGPTYAPPQRTFVAIISVVLYLTFVLVQTVRHRDYFLTESPDIGHGSLPSGATMLAATGLLSVALVGVVMIGKPLAPAIEAGVVAPGAPQALASIGLTIPSVAIVSLLLVLSLFLAVLSLRTGRTTILNGVVHLVLFATYLFLVIPP